MADFLKDLVKELGDGASIAEDGLGSAEFTGFVDTGSYIFNAQMSGSLYGGIPNNKAVAFAGETTTGKTFFCLGIMKHFLDSSPKASVLYFDTEAAVTKKMMQDRGLDPSRVIIDEPLTIPEMGTKVLKFIEAYEKLPESKRPPFMVVLDSLGALSTPKEMGDMLAGSEKKDMTRQQLIRAAMRVVRLKLAKVKVPMLITNHTYSGIGPYAVQEISGGGGLKFASDTIAMLSKRKERVGTEVVGNVIHIKMWKSRGSKENTMVDVLLTYSKGLDRYYGLTELAEKYGIFKKTARGYELPDGTKPFRKNLLEEPEKYFTKSVMDLLEEAAHQEFEYGRGGVAALAADVEEEAAELEEA